MLSDFPPGVDVFDGAQFIVDVALLSILTAADIQTIKLYYAGHSRLEIIVSSRGQWTNRQEGDGDGLARTVVFRTHAEMRRYRSGTKEELPEQRDWIAT
jgi:hypothetical protein